MESPKISIITIVYNKVGEIEHTLKSIIHQTYKNIEYIVIDGNSNDGTKKIIEKHLSGIHTYISEKDKGIYDAMNKGLRKASGDYILFINGGDKLHDINTLQDIFNTSIKSTELPDIIYGECLLIKTDGTPIFTRSKYKHQKFPETLNHFSFKHGTNISHQSFIVKRIIAPRFDLKYKWSSDVDWMLNCIKASQSSIAYNNIISDFVIGGATDKFKIQSLTERFKIMSKHYGFFKTILFHIEILLKKMFK